MTTSLVLSLVLAAAAAGFAWSRLSTSTGNAHVNNILIAAAVSGVVAFLVIFTLLRFVLNIA
jgi:undecaprenyl pyrophosphate phosphatase UppP